MKEITIDFTRCPGIIVCAARTCQTFLGVGFTECIEKSGKGMVSDRAAAEFGGKIEQAIRRCPASAISICECQR